MQTPVEYNERLVLPIDCISMETRNTSSTTNTSTSTIGSTVSKEGILYELFAVILHVGNKANGGHYVTYCKQFDEQVLITYYM